MSAPYRVIKSLRFLLPARARSFIRRYCAMPGYDLFIKEELDAFRDEKPSFHCPDSPCTLGIIRELYHFHDSYVAACRERGISYEIIDITGTDWMEKVERPGCDAFLVWPAIGLTTFKEMFDDRLRIMEEELGKIVYPTWRETWLLDNKRRTRDWLTANSIPLPRTWVFYDKKEAIDFAASTPLPVVFKTNSGGAASGVEIVRSRSRATRIVKRAFGKGIVPRGGNPLDRQRGSVLFQEYLPGVKEWRMIRIGDSYFGYLKGAVGDFHSGTHRKEWLDPGKPLLDLLKMVTDKGRFTSMNVDVFETHDGRYLVNELHALFGQSTTEQMRIEGRMGRYLHDSERDAWIFEEGDFARNACANIRVEWLVREILKKA